MVINALRKEKHVSHFSLDEAIQVAQELQAPQTWSYPYEPPDGQTR